MSRNFVDTDVEKQGAKLPGDWRNQIVDEMDKMFRAASRHGVTMRDEGHTNPVFHVLMKTAGNKLAHVKKMDDADKMGYLVRKTLDRAVGNPQAFEEICRTFRHSTKVFRAEAFVQTFHTVMHAAEGQPRVMRVLTGLLTLMRGGELDDRENPEMAWKAIGDRAITIGESLDGTDFLDSIDDLVEQVMPKIYCGEINHEVAWQVLSDMLIETCVEVDDVQLRFGLVKKPETDEMPKPADLNSGNISRKRTLLR